MARTDGAVRGKGMQQAEADQQLMQLVWQHTSWASFGVELTRERRRDLVSSSAGRWGPCKARDAAGITALTAQVDGRRTS